MLNPSFKQVVDMAFGGDTEGIAIRYLPGAHELTMTEKGD